MEVGDGTYVETTSSMESATIPSEDSKEDWSAAMAAILCLLVGTLWWAGRKGKTTATASTASQTDVFQYTQYRGYLLDELVAEARARDLFPARLKRDVVQQLAAYDADKSQEGKAVGLRVLLG